MIKIPSKKKTRKSYNYTNSKTGKKIHVKSHKVTYHSKEKNRTFESERMMDGVMRKVEVTVKNGKVVHVRVLEDQRKAKPMSYADAKKLFESQPLKSTSMDKKKTAKETFKRDEITTKYLHGSNRYDVEGLDTAEGNKSIQTDILKILKNQGYKDLNNTKKFSPHYEKEIENTKQHLEWLLNDLDPDDYDDREVIDGVNSDLERINRYQSDLKTKDKTINNKKTEEPLKEEGKEADLNISKKKSGKISEDEKQLFNELKERLPKGYKRDIISPTAWARDKPLGDKPYTEYLKEEKLKLDEKDIYRQSYHFSASSSTKLLSPEEFKKEGLSGTYAEYATPLIEQKKEEHRKWLIEAEKKRKIEDEKKHKEAEGYRSKVEQAQTPEELKEVFRQWEMATTVNIKDRKKYKGKMNELQREKIEQEQSYETIDVTVPKWSTESYEILKNARGSEEAFTSEDVFGKNNGKMARIDGPDSQWGLDRSWLGDTEWSSRGRPSTTYRKEELDNLMLGSLVELETRRGKEIYRKTDDNQWKLVSKKEDYNNKVYGVIQKTKVQGRSQQDLQNIVEHSNDFGSRTGAVKQIKDIDYLKDIAITDENYRVRSEAYSRLKELAASEKNEKKKAKTEKTMSELRSYFQQSQEQQQKNENLVYYSAYPQTEKEAKAIVKAINALKKDSRLTKREQESLDNRLKRLKKKYPHLNY